MGNNVPEEVVEEILLRVPARYLLRFKCVCKSWNSLISDQRFINDHLRLNIRNTTNSAASPEIKLVFGWTRQFDDTHENDRYDEDRQVDLRQTMSLLTIDNSKEDDSTYSSYAFGLLPCTIHDIYLPMRPQLLYEGEGVLKSLRVYHCHGILCLVDISPFFSERVAFYNPARLQCKFLLTSRSVDGYFLSECGFGYDSKSDHYKFVRILAPDNKSWVSKAEVYNLGTNTWKVIQFDKHCLPYYMEGVYLNGIYYWLFSDNGSERILSFDMSEDKFSSFALPHTVQNEITVRRMRIVIVVWNESLVYFRRSEKGIFEMWVMGNNSYGDVEWTKHLTIGPLECILRPLLFWKNNELLMEAKDGRIMSYHLRSKRLKKLSFDAPVLLDSIQAFCYVESLVSVLSN